MTAIPVQTTKQILDALNVTISALQLSRVQLNDATGVPATWPVIIDAGCYWLFAVPVPPTAPEHWAWAGQVWRKGDDHPFTYRFADSPADLVAWAGDIMRCEDAGDESWWDEEQRAFAAVQAAAESPAERVVS